MSLEEHRHRCEVRYLLALRARDANAAHEYLKDVEAQRGKPAVERLREDGREQWKRGNRGERGAWIESEPPSA